MLRNPGLYEEMVRYEENTCVFCEIPFINDPSVVLILLREKELLLLKTVDVRLGNTGQGILNCPETHDVFVHLRTLRDAFYRLTVPELACDSQIKSNLYRNVSRHPVKLGVYLRDHTGEELMNSDGRCYVNFPPHGFFQKGSHFVWTKENSYRDIFNCIRGRFYNCRQPLLTQIRNALLLPQAKPVPFVFSDVQKDLIYNSEGRNRRVEGEAGTGKTFVGAARAVLRASEGKRVLFLYFNITLLRNIRSKIQALVASRNDGTVIMSRISIIHYHEYMKGVWRKYRRRYPEDEDLLDFHLTNEDMIRPWEDRYDTVIADESQDFKEAYFDNLRRIFPGAEFLFLADFDQNIYRRSYETNNRRPAMRGFSFPVAGWEKMKGNLRASREYKVMVDDFCISFGLKEENRKVRGFETNTLGAGFSEGLILNYCYINSHPSFKNRNPEKLNEIYEIYGDVVKMIKAYMQTNGLSPKDTVILACTKESIVLMMNSFSNMDRNVRIESAIGLVGGMDIEKYMKEKDERPNDDAVYDKGRKYAFDVGSESVKMSTVHSYKGYETDNVIFLMDCGKDFNESLALAYTAITRSRKNLFVIGFKDCGNQQVKDYFKNTYTDYVPF